jgi:hypothetical protein
MIKFFYGPFCVLTFALAAVASAEPMVLDATDMDSVTAGADGDRYGAALADARARGTRAFSYTRTLTRVDASQTVAAPAGVGTAYVSATSTAYANGLGQDTSFETIAIVENVQPGIVGGPGTRVWNRVGNFSSFSTASTLSVSSWEYDRHFLMTQGLR